MNLHEANNIVILYINLYLKQCRIKNKQPDYNMIKKFARRKIRELYQERAGAKK